MKRLLALILLFTVVMAAVPVSPSYAAVECKDNVLDNVYDWFTTLGKEGAEKEQVLAKNKAERLKTCMEKNAAQAKKEAEKAGQDMKKKLGL